MRASQVLSVCLGCFTASQAYSQDSKPPPISTDRPTFSDSSSLSGLNKWQIESGTTFTRSPGNNLTTLGELILRRQVSQNLELRAVNLGLGFPEHGTAGLQDPAFGIKYRFLTGTSRRPEVSAILLSSLPVGSPTFRTNAFQPTAKIAWSQGISPIWSVAGNFLYSRLGSGSGAFDQWSASFYVTQALSGTRSAFYEVYGQNTEGPETPGALFGDVGILQLIGNDCQLDARIGSASNEKSNGWFVGAGVSWRF
jgi:hypothetical protein